MRRSADVGGETAVGVDRTARAASVARWVLRAAAVAAGGAALVAATGRAAAGGRTRQRPATGRIEGVITVDPRLAAAFQRVWAYGQPPTAEAAPDSAENPLAHAVVYLDATPALRRRGSGREAVAMRLRGQQFEPHVLAILAGTAVMFPNHDRVYHSVFSLSEVRGFDLGRYPLGSSKTVVFRRPGVVHVACHIYADMGGFILVLDNPHFTMPDTAGRFVLRGVPPGVYRLVAWQERIRPVAVPVRVEAGRTTSLELHIPVPDTADIR